MTTSDKNTNELGDQGTPPRGFLAGVFQSRYREATLSAVVTGLVIGLVMNAAITYSGLKIGFTIGGSAIAAVLGFAVLRGLFRKGSIVETNIVQTVASAVGNSNAGVIFTLPALLMLGVKFDATLVALACMAGVVLGVAFIIPLRRQMLDLERLRFPSAYAVAAILKAPGAGPKKALVLVIGALLAGLIYLPTQLPKIRTLASPGTLASQAVELSSSEQRTLKQADSYLWGRTYVTLPEAEFAALGSDASNADSVFTRYAKDDVRRTLLLQSWLDAGEPDATWIERGRIERERAAAAYEGQKLAEAMELPWVADEGSTVLPGSIGKLLILAADIADGEADVSAVKHINYWASRPLPGYGALGLRGLREIERQPEFQAEIDSSETLTAMLSRHTRERVIGGDSAVNVGSLLGLPAVLGLVIAITPLSFGAGFLTGRPGIVVTAGGLLAFIVIAPASLSLGWLPSSTADASVSNVGLGLITRPMGIGMLMGGAFMGVLAALPAMKAAFAGMAKSKGGGTLALAARDEMPMKTLGFAIVACFFVLYFAAHFAEGAGETGGLIGWMNPWVKHAIVAMIGTVWIWFAGIIVAQCSGMTDWSPISGLALMTVLFIVLLTNEVVAAVMVGAALCVAISLAADMMGDLKVGSLVGASPRRQQFLELCTAIAGPAIAIAVTIALHKAFTLGTPDFPAPQGQALKAGIEGITGAGLPYALYAAGIGLGAMLGLGSFAGLGVLVGLSMYLPVVYIYAYGLGCITNLVVERIKGKEWIGEWCMPFFGGVIIGESVLGIVFAGIIIAQSA